MRKRSWFRVHSFTGVITGLLLFVVCWSGSFAVVSSELDWLVTPEVRVPAGGTDASWDELLQAVRQWRDDAEVLRLQAPLYDSAAALAVVNLPRQSFVHVYIDPHTAEVLGHYSGVNLKRFFRELHRRIFLGDPGLYLVCALGVTLLVSMIAALSFYKRWWRRFFRFKRGSPRVFFSELHKSAGLWSLWFILIMGVTGLWYLFEAGRSDFGDGIAAYAGRAEFSVHEIPEPKADSGQSRRSLHELLTRAGQLRSDLEVRSVSFADNKIVVAGQAGHLLVRDRANQLHLDARTGEVLYNQRAGDLPLYWRWSDTADPLHFGDFGGLASKLIWFLFGLLLSGLILTGTWLHARRLGRQAGSRSRHRWPGTGAAIAVTLLVLTAAVPAGFSGARAFFGPTVDGVAQLPTLAPGVKAVIIGWILATFGIIAGWVWMLWRPPGTARGGHRGRKAPE